MIEPLSPLSVIVNPDGTPTANFQNWSQRVLAAITKLEKQALGSAAAQAATQTASNTAAGTAQAAYEDTTGATVQERSATATLDVDTNWTAAATVTFEAATAVTHVTTEDSGPQFFSYFTAPYITGSARLIKTVLGVDTTLATQAFTIDSELNLYWPTFAYDAADSDTGPISYRLEVKTDGGNLYGLTLITHIKRTP